MIAAQAPRNRKNAGIVSSKERNKRPAGTDVWWVRMRCMVEAGGVEPPSEDSLLRATITTCYSDRYLFKLSFEPV